VNTPAIELHAVEFSWKGQERLLDVERFTVDRGERVFLQGPSGSGKSTLLGLIGGVLTPVSGSVSLLGTQLSNLGASGRDRFRGEHLGFIFQMFNLIPYLTVRENVLLPLKFSAARRQRLAGLAPAAEALRLLGALGLLGQGLLERQVTQLSIGQQQRVAAARALIGRPEILVADEPTSALDADTRADFLELLMNECRAFDITLLFVSHDSSLSGLFDRALAMTDLNRAPAQVM
jgi:putative ABC transport system ATP-binding protein